MRQNNFNSLSSIPMTVPFFGLTILPIRIRGVWSGWDGATNSATILT